MGEGNVHSKLIIHLAQILIDPRRHKRKSLSAALAHNHETQVLEVRRQVVGGAREVEHNTPVAPLAEADELVVLADDLGCAAREVKGKGGLVGAEVVDVEDEFLRKVFGVAPDDPADAGVDEAVLVTTRC
jgi:hypothetical protein